MKSSYFVVKFTHAKNDTCLAHIAIHLSDAQNWKIATRYGRAKYLRDHEVSESKNFHGWCDTFTLMMLNTKEEDWKTEKFNGPYTKEEAIKLKFKLNKQLEDEGFTISSYRNTAQSKHNGTPCPTFVNGFLYAATTDLKKLKRFVSKITHGLNISVKDHNNILNLCYNTLIGAEGKISKRSVWLMFRDVGI